MLTLDVSDYTITKEEEQQAAQLETTLTEIEQPFLLQNQLARALAGDEGLDDIFKRVTDIEFDSDNIRSGTTMDSHRSYRKKDEESEAWLTYTITLHEDGPVYMYLPTKYERETEMYINGVYRGNYYLYENYSIEYLGTYSEGESFELQFKLLDNAVYFKEAQFFYADTAALESFNAALSVRNAETQLTRTSGDTLELSVNAEEDCVLFATIPAEEGWTVLVDGKETKWTTAMGGALIAVPVSAGEHTIVLDFFPAGMKLGLLLTAMGAAAFALLIAVVWLDRKRMARVADGESAKGAVK